MTELLLCRRSKGAMYIWVSNLFAVVWTVF
jgi:hypothetical protein